MQSKPFAHGLDTGFLLSAWLLQSILLFLLGILASFQMQQIFHASIHHLLNVVVVIHLLWVVRTRQETSHDSVCGMLNQFHHMVKDPGVS